MATSWCAGINLDFRASSQTATTNKLITKHIHACTQLVSFKVKKEDYKVLCIATTLLAGEKGLSAAGRLPAKKSDKKLISLPPLFLSILPRIQERVMQDLLA